MLSCHLFRFNWVAKLILFHKCTKYFLKKEDKCIILDFYHQTLSAHNNAGASYTWDDIKEFFCILTLNQLRLVNKDGLHKQSVWDKVLFQGAKDCNISIMQYAIDNGANTQSLDSFGESVLVSVVENARYPESDNDTNKIIEAIDFLLTKGADINAFGVDGIPPLMEAYYANSPDWVKHLLKKDANVNFNCYLMDCQYWPRLRQVKCSIIEDIENSTEDDLSEVIEIEKLIRDAGGLSTDFTTT